MNSEPNWSEIEKCQLWRVLGVIECDDCKSLIKCWGTNSQLPESKGKPVVAQTLADKDGDLMPLIATN